MPTLPTCSFVAKPGFASLSLDPSVFVLGEKILLPGMEGRDVAMVRKHEFHVTLIGRRNQFFDRLMTRRGISRAEAEDIGLQMFMSAARGVKFSVNVLRSAHVVSKVYPKPRPHLRWAVIADCEVQGADRFYDRLTGFSGIAIDDVPHHVTIFTNRTKLGRQGIGLNTRSELIARTRTSFSCVIIRDDSPQSVMP